jgi:hypothetical protein
MIVTGERSRSRGVTQASTPTDNTGERSRSRGVTQASTPTDSTGERSRSRGVTQASTPTDNTGERSRGSAAVYLSRAAWEQLDAAQGIVDQHACDTRGVCRICLVPDPCPARAAAAARINRYGRLPRRRPEPAVASRFADPASATMEFTWFDRGLVGA